MNAKETRQYEMLLRVRDFGNTHRELFAGSSVAQQAFAAVGAGIDDLTATDMRKMSASMSARAGRKAVAREALTDTLLKVSQLVKVLRARGQATPPFECPESRSDQALLTAGRQFARDAAALEAEFTGHGMAPTHIAGMTADPRLRRPAKGGNQGQRGAAAPLFLRIFSHPRLPGPTPSRYRLSVNCQSSSVTTSHDGCLPSRCSRKDFQHFRHQRLQIRECIAFRLQHHNRDVECRQVLLVLEFAIDCQEGVELRRNGEP